MIWIPNQTLINELPIWFRFQYQLTAYLFKYQIEYQ